MNKSFHSFQKSKFLSLTYIFILLPFLIVFSGVFILGIFTFGTSCMELRCMWPYSMMPRKQIKMWLWEIIPVKHNSRTGQTRCFMILWGASHCQAWKWWGAGFCEEQLVHPEFLGGKWPYVCMNFDIIF